MKSRFLTAGVVVLLAIVTACSDDATQPDVRVALVEVSPAGGSVRVQQTLQLHAIAKTASGDELQGKAITWSSSDEAFATVSAAGLVTGVAAGTVAITAASEGRRRTVQVEVTEEPAPPPPPPPPPNPPPPPPNPVPELTELSPDHIDAGTSALTLTVHGAQFALGATVLWNGVSRTAEYVSASELRVELTAEDLAVAATREVRVFNPAPGGGTSDPLGFTIAALGPRLRLDVDAVDLPIGDTVKVRATVYDASGTPVPGVPVTWIHNDNEVVLLRFGPLVERRDSMRIFSRGAGISVRVIARTDDGLADTVLVRLLGIDEEMAVVNAGTGVTCGLDVAGRPYCWGHTYPSEAMYAPLPIRDGAGSPRFTFFDTGHSHACALTATGTPYCWGDNIEGALGNGTLFPSAEPVAVLGGHSFVTLSNEFHACALTVTGEAWCWGTNIYGQIGDSTLTNALVPVPVKGNHTFASIFAGPYHSCGLSVEGPGQALCWGYNSAGQAGDDLGGCEDPVTHAKIPCNLTPARVSTDLRFVSLAAGGFHTCGLTAEGEVYCWGDGSLGQLGRGTTESSRSPVAVLGSQTFSSIGASYGNTCGLTVAGKVYCWGQNDYGNNGVEPTQGQICVVGNTGYRCNTLPVAVSGGLTFDTLSVGGRHACARTTAGINYCWGHNLNGEIGVGNSARSSHPTPQQVWDGRRQ